MTKKRTWNDSSFIEAVKNNLSIAGVCRDLGLAPLGGNYSTIRKHAARLNLDISHWTGKGWNTGDRYTPIAKREPLETILINGRYFSTYHLKTRLIREGVLENKCSLCKIDQWLDKPLVLHLDHINGIINDLRLKNLRLLCPNCHSQTDTYCGKSKGKK